MESWNFENLMEILPILITFYSFIQFIGKILDLFILICK